MTTPIADVSGKKFDFVIIGGGTSGLALAARLSEDDVSVLVLEAGSANLGDPMLLTPALFGAHFKNPKYDWNFETAPQKSLGGRSVYFARGKTLGGSSAINFLQFHLPSKSDIEGNRFTLSEFAIIQTQLAAFEELGNPNWNWNVLKKYYDKFCGSIPPKETTGTTTYAAHQGNEDGPVKYSHPMVPSGFEEPYHEALKNIGIDRVQDPFCGDINGTWITPVSTNPETKSRTYAANAYYTPNQNRTNLAVLVDAQVIKINLTSELNEVVTATGVTFLHNGKTHEVSARKEVILSAGAIMSPQILEISGIGNKDILEKAGVEVIVNLPGVGENVQEHIYSGTTFEVKSEISDQFMTFDCLKDPVQRAKQTELLAQGKGALGMVPSCMTFIPIAKATPAAEEIYQRLKDTINSGTTSNRYSNGLQKQYKILLKKIEQGEFFCETVLAQGFSTGPCDFTGAREKYITMMSFLNHPFSRGTIHIQSADALKPPAIDPHYFEVEQDLRIFIELVKFNRRLVKDKSLATLITGEEINPGLEAGTDEAIGNYLKQRFSTTFHTVGSCSMLPLADGGVVNHKLTVYGTANLRVVDISIVPLIVGPHLQTTAYAIGEIAADIIKGKI
ncbi:GMC oxidoreductase [Hypholoma sublateritium FD-334 SS-4]|uniref:pyranose dehydrogenase (acceptor) n=1 Tax=Hypholoma sublateritium (strain FD-334 SS-4) TaxID=945553 RepID=A0A0D2L5K2_HYPSF|nr:GMC oxidoreductase [Hypholoma sublateritium FD-334 SS-4]